MKCESCGERVRLNEPGVWSLIEGWVQRRSGGGTHAVSEPVALGKFMHDVCYKERKYSGKQAESLF